MVNKELGYLAGVALLLVAVVALAVLLVRCHGNETFCGRCADSPNMCGACTGIGLKTCPDRALVSKLYNEGKLTEYSGWGDEKLEWSSPLDDIMNYEGCKPEWPPSNYV